MKKLILIIVLFLNLGGFSQILDSTKFYGKIEELKNLGNVEFTISICTVNSENIEELNIILEHIKKNIIPKGYVLYGSNGKTFYPKNEYINNGTSKKIEDKYFLINKNGVEDNFSTTILIIGSRMDWEL